MSSVKETCNIHIHMDINNQKYTFVKYVKGGAWDTVPNIDLTDTTTFGEFMQTIHSLQKQRANFRIFAENSSVTFQHNIYLANKKGEDVSKQPTTAIKKVTNKVQSIQKLPNKDPKDVRIQELEYTNRKALYRINILIRSMDEMDNKMAELQSRLKETQIKERAYQIWQETGESDMEKNYYQAEREHISVLEY